VNEAFERLVEAAVGAKVALPCFNPHCLHPRSYHRADPSNIVNAPIGEGHATFCDASGCECRVYMRGYQEIRLDAAVREARKADNAQYSRQPEREP
jgi:hypothetical protein